MTIRNIVTAALDYLAAQMDSKPFYEARDATLKHFDELLAKPVPMIRDDEEKFEDLVFPG